MTIKKSHYVYNLKAKFSKLHKISRRGFVCYLWLKTWPWLLDWKCLVYTGWSNKNRPRTFRYKNRNIHINDLKLCASLEQPFYDIVSTFNKITAFLQNMLFEHLYRMSKTKRTQTFHNNSLNIHITDLKLCICLQQSFCNIVSKFEVNMPMETKIKAFLQKELNVSTSALAAKVPPARQFSILIPFVEML